MKGSGKEKGGVKGVRPSRVTHL